MVNCSSGGEINNPDTPEQTNSFYSGTLGIAKGAGIS